jgi:hypothetical protein
VFGYWCSLFSTRDKNITSNWDKAISTWVRPVSSGSVNSAGSVHFGSVHFAAGSGHFLSGPVLFKPFHFQFRSFWSRFSPIPTISLSVQPNQFRLVFC